MSITYLTLKVFQGSHKRRQTVKHLEVSLGALFLLNAAKKADKAFCVTPPGGKHTVRETCRDIKTITHTYLGHTSLLGLQRPEDRATLLLSSRSSPITWSHP